jgi:preprotein translocase subunit SecE
LFLKPKNMENKQENKFVSFFKGAIAELKKVVWPTRKQAIRLTLIVVGVVVATAIFLGGFDLLFSEGIRLLISRS